jgi:soluble lytic murein transglycosylase-like protein
MTKLSPKPELIALAKNTANAHGLEPKVVCALIHVESAWTPEAIRYEPGYYRRKLEDKTRDQLVGFRPHLIPTIETEKVLRACSFGLMQIMGDTARSLGYQEKWLTDLFNPQANLTLGCSFLAQILDVCKTYEKALLRYNGGGNPRYPDVVLAVADMYVEQQPDS